MIDINIEINKLVDIEVHAESLNGDYPAHVMCNIPCTIGFTYIRIEADGSIKPCCVAPFSMGSLNNLSFEEVWHSSQYNAWRTKFLKIHQKNFHLKDKNFSFCQICPHIPQNIEFINVYTKNQE